MRLRVSGVILLPMLLASFFLSCTTSIDINTNVSGTLGSKTNPVRCDMPQGAHEYLNRLYGPMGEPARFFRIGSFEAGPYGNILDGYAVKAGAIETAIFMDMYHPGYVETECVPGFTLVKSPGDAPPVIPTGQAEQAKLLKHLIESVDSEDSGEMLALKISALASAGIDVNGKDAEGNTALLVAADHLLRPSAVFKALLDAGANVNAQNQDGETALHMTVDWGNVDLDAVKLLIEAGIHVNATDKMGDTAFCAVEFFLDDEAALKEEGKKPNTRLAAARILLEAGAGEWEKYMGGPVTVVPGPPKVVHPVVAKLSDPTERDDAFREILSWQKYRTKPSFPERIFNPLRHVVICPQTIGPPIYAVFPWSHIENRNEPKGHIVLIDADGALIPYYRNANFLDEESTFKDVNGDGVVDEVGLIAFSKAYVLHVLPVTRDHHPILNVALRQKGFKSTEWAWRLVETGEPNVYAIELGPLDIETWKMTPKARYEWSKAENRYVGPPGGVKLPFMRLSVHTTSNHAEYNAFVSQENEEETIQKSLQKDKK